MESNNRWPAGRGGEFQFPRFVYARPRSRCRRPTCGTGKLRLSLRDADSSLSGRTNLRHRIGQPVALAGPRPHAPVAARRAFEFAQIPGKIHTLLNFQPPAENRNADEVIADPYDQGETAIEDVAEKAGLAPTDFESRVVVGDDIESTILKNITSSAFVCIGVSEQQEILKILRGSPAGRVVQDGTGNVALIQSDIKTHRTVRGGIIERLSQTSEEESQPNDNPST